ncbi:arylesterase [Rhodoplanes roseus]|uniref:arylesterase n=1 Tax=Rhodoplanes roseus TaxID=29409 RepID=UPI000DAB7E0A
MVAGAVLLAGVGTTGAAGQTAAAPLRIVALGDSLVAGYGLPPGDAFPVRLQKALAGGGRTGRPVEIVNAGVSGDTATDGLSRLDWAIGDDVDGVIVELGANDALRGIDPAVTRKALDEVLKRLTARGLPVLLAGMLAPPNLGPAYKAAFDPIFPELAAAHGTLLYPFFLDGVAAERGLNQPDGMHPNGKGVGVIVERILPKVEELIALAAARRDRS